MENDPRQPSEPPKPPIPIPADYDEARVRAEFWPKLKRFAARVPGLSDVLSLWFYLRSGKAPQAHKVSILATLAYFVMPLDLIPDWFGALGLTDDVAAALGMIAFLGSETMRPYRALAKRWLAKKSGADGADDRPPPDTPREIECEIRILR